MLFQDKLFTNIVSLSGGWFAVSLLAIFGSSVTAADPDPSAALLGRWDLTVDGADGPFPSWLEVRKSGDSTLVGSFVGQFGSARPIAKIEASDAGFLFTIPPQWEKRSDDLVFTFALDGNKLTGNTTDEKGGQLSFTGVRAPSLKRSRAPSWGPSIELFNGRNLDGWKVQLADVPNGWVVRGGRLFNETPGNNLVSDQTFDDFQLHAEFRYPAGSNSGIYLRGRYEVQIEDNFGKEVECHNIGGVYGFLTPSVNASKPAGEWQSYDITFVGRTVTVVLNGERVIDRQAIPGPTGGALDSNEAAPGPILIQGDHGPIEFRKITITPAE
jgi:hypothetical protein